ncbi:ABC transporter substrate-binding protein [Bartonella sp. HY329]|uniref:heme/hemin ABC transporter substrate-binding protein n=1 Tax=unclassified Bartonella TaxID=2645622 RepID=UPI0021C64918|nr:MULTISPECIES: ABC transporter substrate-binding protein [unclassified Bartonella]UXM94461.1 ABC transporter substrate-binding protein [Bartonella sp. HY329]UXN08785.1 ABC transporter substrate-binding protein [Bartonella sp. HY328]
MKNIHYIIMLAIFILVKTISPSLSQDSNHAQKIIVLGPDLSDIVYKLGAEDRVIALDRSSHFLLNAHDKVNVGYARRLSTEGILSLDFDLIIASNSMGPPETVDMLKESGANILFVTAENTRNGIIEKITTIAKKLELVDQGENLKNEVLADFDDAVAYANKVPLNERKKVVFFHGAGQLNAAGKNTNADAFIEYAGAINPFNTYNGYKPVTREALLLAAPDVILAISNGKGGPAIDDVLSNDALDGTPAAINKAVIIIDDPYMIGVGFGPRTGAALKKLTRALYYKP